MEPMFSSETSADLNLGRNTAYPEEGSLWLYSVSPDKCWNRTSIRTLPLPSKSFPIHHSTYHLTLYSIDTEKKIRGFESASKLYRSSDRRRSAKLVPTSADRGCHVVSATSLSDRNFDFLDLEPLLFLPSSSSNCSRG
jgi:hypothetical protein